MAYRRDRKPDELANVRVRIPESLRAKIEAEAVNNGRSLASEIEAMLNHYFEPTILADEVYRLLDNLKTAHARDLKKARGK